MQIIRGKVLFVNPPKGNQRTGNVKLQTATGPQYIGNIKDLSQFNPGENIIVETKEREWEGRVYLDFVKFVAASGQTGQRAASNSGTVSSSSPTGGHQNPDAMMIFITGVVGRSMQSGQFGLEDIIFLTRGAKSAYEQVILGKPQATDTPVQQTSRVATAIQRSNPSNSSNSRSEPESEPFDDDISDVGRDRSESHDRFAPPF